MIYLINQNETLYCNAHRIAWFWFMVLNATFNNISVKSWRRKDWYSMKLSNGYHGGKYNRSYRVGKFSTSYRGVNITLEIVGVNITLAIMG
jgi:hypothetical protein